MKSKTNEQEICLAVADLVSIVREHSQSQREQWQRIPYLALQADGRSGYSDNLRRAYVNKMWALGCSTDTCGYHVIPTGGKPRQATVEQVLVVAAHPEEIDAQRIIRWLEEEARRPYPSYYEPEKQEAWRNKAMKKLKLEP